MATDIIAFVATSLTTPMVELMSAHPSLLDRIVFKHIFHQKFSPKKIQINILLNITQIYNNMIITEVHTPLYI
jgi:hypothetical protein